MGISKVPSSLRARRTTKTLEDRTDNHQGRSITAVAGLIAIASIGAAKAQQSPLPPVTVDAPKERPHRTTSTPSADHNRARSALRRAGRRQQQAVQSAVPYPNAGGLTPPDANPYADAAAPYKVDHVASSKFPDKLVNTPKTITVLSKEILEDKNATSLKEVGRTTAGVTLGTGEGGNAFGDRFFIRGFDARNDVFVDGIRDPAVSVRENFFTEQVEILRGPASSYAGRGTAGGAINIVTKQAGDRNFYNAESQTTTDSGRRVTFDVNQVINPTLSVRTGGLYQESGVAGRSLTTDNRWGTFAAVKYAPTDNFKITGSYVHTDLWGLPDFGVPYLHSGNLNGPATEYGVPRNQYYGFVNRDFQKATQDIGTIGGELKVNDITTLSSKFRAERSVLSYVGTIPESPVTTNSNPLLWDVYRKPTKPLSDGDDLRQPKRRDVQIRFRALDPHDGHRRRVFRGSDRDLDLFGFEFGNGADRRCGLHGIRKSVETTDLQPGLHGPAVQQFADPVGEPLDRERRHEERVRNPHGQLQRCLHPQWWHPLRRL